MDSQGVNPMNTTIGIYTLDDIQERTLNSIRDAMRRGKRRVLVVAPTGCGKTVLSLAIAKLAAEKNTQVDFVVSGKPLVAQTEKKAQKADLEHSVWIAGHDDPFNHFSPFRIISKDTLESRREGSRWTPGKIIIVDEVDISLSEIWQKLQSEYEYVVGLTGTPCDGRGLGLGTHFDEMVVAAHYSDLIKSGRLVDVPESCCFSPYRPDLDGAKLGADGDFQKTWLSSRMDKDKLVGDVVHYWTKLAQERPTLVCCVDKKHTVHVCEAFNKEGINAEYVIDDTQEKERQEIFKRVERGETRVIVNCATLTRGFDLPCISCLVLAKPTKRLRTYLQMVGRVLRSCPGKTDAIVIDHSGSVWRHGWPTEDRDWTLDATVSTEELREKSSKPKQEVERFCPECACLMKFSQVCPNCGYKKPVRSQQAETVDGKLVNVKKSQVKKKNPEKNEFQQLWMMCLAVMANCGKTYAQSASMFHGKTGQWPEQAGVGPTCKFHERQMKVAALWPNFIRRKKGA